MKQTLIIFVNEVNEKNFKTKKIIRSVHLDPSFVGFGKKGVVNHDEVRRLVADLEPTSNGYDLA